MASRTNRLKLQPRSGVGRIAPPHFSTFFGIMSMASAIDRSDEATFFAALQPSYVTAIRNPLTRKYGTVPAKLTGPDLNILNDKSSLFHVRHALYSAANIKAGRSPWLLKSRTPGTTLLGDSGGFQVVGGEDVDPLQAFLWLSEDCDWSMTLDAPIACILNGKSKYKTFVACREWSLENLDQFNRLYDPTKAKFANILQCPNRRQAHVWYEAVKCYFKALGGFCDGVAFAGPLKTDFLLVLELLDRLDRDGVLHTLERIHVLGTARACDACILSAMQDAVHSYVGRRIPVGFDASTASSSMEHGGDATVVYVGLNTQTFQMRSNNVPFKKKYFGSKLAFPWRSAVGKLITLGDLVVSDVEGHYYDYLSYALIQHHNIEVITRAIVQAQQLARMMDPQYAPPDILETCKAIRGFFKVPTAARGAYLSSNDALLSTWAEPAIVDDATDHT